MTSAKPPSSPAKIDAGVARLARSVSTVALFDVMPQLGWATDEKGLAYFYNARWYEYTGTAPEQMEGSGWQSVHDPSVLPEVLKRWRSALTTGEPFDMVVPLRRRDGVFRRFRTHAVPQRDADGKVVGWIAISTDIEAEFLIEQQRKRATDEQLHASEERFHSLVDAVTEYAIFMLDGAGRITTWNVGAHRIKGYETGEIIGKHFSVFYTPEDRAAGKPERILEAVRTEGRFEDEGWRVRKDGSRFWANVVITALRNQRGDFIGFAKVTRDLTARRQAEDNERTLVSERLARDATENERRRLLTLLEQVPAVVNFLRGPELTWEFVHPKAVKTMGGRDVLGKPFLAAVPEMAEQPFYEKLQRVYETGELFTQTEALAWHDIGGRRVESYWNSIYLPVRDPETGVIEGVMTFDLDVTESVRARRALEEVSRENARAREELEKLNRAKDEFLATMSHELRTPLQAIHGWAALLQKNPLDQSKLEKGLEVIERNARAQTRLVSDLLDVSRIISGKLQLGLAKVALSPLIQAAAEIVRPAAESKDLRLVLDVDPNIGEAMVDADRLHQVLWNLLINAVRYTPRGGRVSVNADRTDSGIVIAVRDTGVGIAREHLPRIFERFWQVDGSTTRAHGGLGLGLAIVRHLVELHGGTVAATSDGPDQGTAFTVKLPIHAVNTTRSDQSRLSAELKEDSHLVRPRPGVTLEGVRVLVIDDEPDSMEVIRVVLEQAGAGVTAVRDGWSALTALDGRSFDIVVSDIGMPEMDGYTLMRRIRSSLGSDVPAIALTAFARADDAERAAQAGYQQHLSKPVDDVRLIEAVKTLARPRSQTTPA
jgi:PAS domain S-box-containing protein